MVRGRNRGTSRAILDKSLFFTCMLCSFSPRNRALAVYVCLGLTARLGWAQAPAPQAAPAPQTAPAPAGLPPPAPVQTMPNVIQPGIRILVLQGQRSINNVPNGMVTVPVVEIRDENDRPVEGAKVVFTLPAEGGAFEKGGATAEIVTNYQGQAVCPAYKPLRCHLVWMSMPPCRSCLAAVHCWCWPCIWSGGS